jgi:hypothetical protein
MSPSRPTPLRMGHDDLVMAMLMMMMVVVVVV